MTESIEGTNKLNKICNCVSDGGSLITYCKKEGLGYGKTVNWIYQDEDRQKQYEVALEARGEFVAQRILLELNRLGFSDPRRLFDNDGTIKDVSTLDDDVAAAIVGIDVQEARVDKDGDEIEPLTKKIKLADKLKAIELLGKHLKMFTDKHEISGKMTLEDLVTGSMGKAEDEPASEPKEETDAKEKESPSEEVDEI